MIKEFFEEHAHLRLSLQYSAWLNSDDSGWKIQIYNTTFDCGVEPIFKHYITDETINKLLVDFETAIMTPILNWWEECEKQIRE